MGVGVEQLGWPVAGVLALIPPSRKTLSYDPDTCIWIVPFHTIPKAPPPVPPGALAVERSELKIVKGYRKRKDSERRGSGDRH